MLRLHLQTQHKAALILTLIKRADAPNEGAAGLKDLEVLWNSHKLLNTALVSSP